MENQNDDEVLPPAALEEGTRRGKRVQRKKQFSEEFIEEWDDGEDEMRKTKDNTARISNKKMKSAGLTGATTTSSTLPLHHDLSLHASDSSLVPLMSSSSAPTSIFSIPDSSPVTTTQGTSVTVSASNGLHLVASPTNVLPPISSASAQEKQSDEKQQSDVKQVKRRMTHISQNSGECSLRASVFEMKYGWIAVEFSIGNSSGEIRHTCNVPIQFLPLTKKDKNLATYLVQTLGVNAAKEELQNLLEDLSVDPNQIFHQQHRRVHTLTTSELKNFEDPELKAPPKGEEDLKRAKVLIKDWYEKGKIDMPIVKCPGVAPDSTDNIGLTPEMAGLLTKGDFLIVFNTPLMREVAKRYPQVLSTDGTHTVTVYSKIVCITFMVFLSKAVNGTLNRERGMPVMWALANSERADVIRVVALHAKTVFGSTFQPQALMTDMAFAAGNAFDVVFPGIDKFWCKWHVIDALRKRIDKVFVNDIEYLGKTLSIDIRDVNKHVRGVLKNRLFSLLAPKEDDVLLEREQLVQALEEVVTFLYLVGDAGFAESIKTRYLPYVDRLAEFHRQAMSMKLFGSKRAPPIATNNSLEAFHRVYKYLFLKGVAAKGVTTVLKVFYRYALKIACDVLASDALAGGVSTHHTTSTTSTTTTTATTFTPNIDEASEKDGDMVQTEEMLDELTPEEANKLEKRFFDTEDHSEVEPNVDDGDEDFTLPRSSPSTTRGNSQGVPSELLLTRAKATATALQSLTEESVAHMVPPQRKQLLNFLDKIDAAVMPVDDTLGVLSQRTTIDGNSSQMTLADVRDALQPSTSRNPIRLVSQQAWQQAGYAMSDGAPIDVSTLEKQKTASSKKPMLKTTVAWTVVSQAVKSDESIKIIAKNKMGWDHRTWAVMRMSLNTLTKNDLVGVLRELGGFAVKSSAKDEVVRRIVEQLDKHAPNQGQNEWVSNIGGLAVVTCDCEVGVRGTVLLLKASSINSDDCPCLHPEAPLVAFKIDGLDIREVAVEQDWVRLVSTSKIL